MNGRSAAELVRATMRIHYSCRCTFFMDIYVPVMGGVPVNECGKSFLRDNTLYI